MKKDVLAIIITLIVLIIILSLPKIIIAIIHLLAGIFIIFYMCQNNCRVDIRRRIKCI